ncbi:MAG: hypothetical protein GY925_28790 [Actinomycetia bacterium]|nr:hypothetical protein [Actinomycetes bacterium]
MTSCPVEATRFADTSRGRPEKWHWEFPNSATSTEQNPFLLHEVSGVVQPTVTRDDEASSVSYEVHNNLFC